MNNREHKRKLIDIIIYSMMIVAVVYIIVQTILGNNGETSFKITLGLWMLGAVIVLDFVEPFICKTFDGMTGKAAAVYGLYAVFDAVAFVCLYIFVINIGYTKEPIHYIFLGVAVVFFIGRIFFGTVYKGIKDETAEIEETESESEPEPEIIEMDDVEVNTLSEEDEEDIKVMVFRNRNN